jgi:hypothetical protein
VNEGHAVILLSEPGNGASPRNQAQETKLKKPSSRNQAQETKLKKPTQETKLMTRRRSS